ncbi:guanine nucleotide exchange factor [Peziza echinospora]|nr:guanine nucleotide exchange factor [Peziza echinospora]
MTAILAADVASLSLGPVNPDSFAPEGDADRQAEEGEAKWEGKGKGKETESPLSPPPPPPPPKDRIYLDTTPMTPLPSAPSSIAGSPPRVSPLKPAFEEGNSPRGKQHRSDSDDEDPQAEIHSILDQFEPGHAGQPVAGAADPPPNYTSPIPEAMSRSNSFNLNPPRHPPRTSSLEAIRVISPQTMTRTLSSASAKSDNAHPSQIQESRRLSNSFEPNTQLEDIPPPPPPRPKTVSTPPISTPTLHKPPPPELDPDLPFDFHRFLEQLRHRTADPVAKYLKSFLTEFSKKQWTVQEQVKIIHDFLHFIVGKMAQCEVWREVSEQEFDNAKEGMEKLVMNRLYTQTFSPAIPPAPPTPPSGSRRRHRPPMAVGRQGQHQDDVERDEILAQKVRIYGWVREEHLDIAPVGDSGRRFLNLAKAELEKIKTYRAPRDKVICVLNCCKVIFGLIRHSDGDESADRFVPLLIYVVLRANPDHLVSNIQYILRFRNPEKLGGEAGYYLSSLMGAIQYIESLDRSSLTITAEEFERNVEKAVAAIAEKPPPQEPAPPSLPPRPSMDSNFLAPMRPVSPRPISDAQASSAAISAPPTPTSANFSEKANVSSDPEEAAPVAGLLRTIQKPLSTIGRIFGETTASSPNSAAESSGPTEAPRNSPLPRKKGVLSAEEAAARQASAEAAEAHRIQQAEHENVVGVLESMFPGLDRDIISDVVVQKEGRVGLAVDACLVLTSG